MDYRPTIYIREGGKFKSIGNIFYLGNRKTYIRQGRAFKEFSIAPLRRKQINDMRTAWRGKGEIYKEQYGNFANDVLHAYCLLDNWQAKDALSIAYTYSIDKTYERVTYKFEELLALCGIEF